MPLAFVTGYSLVQFESAIDEELFKRLKGNSREITAVFDDLEDFLVKHSRSHASDTALVYNMATSSIPATRRIVTGWMNANSPSSISLFDREGRVVISLYKDEEDNVKSATNLESGNVYMPDAILKRLNDTPQLTYRDISPKYGFELIVYTKLLTQKGVLAGYLEEDININESYLKMLKKRLNFEILLFDRNVNPVAATFTDFLQVQKSFFAEKVNEKKEAFFEMQARDVPYGVLITPIRSGESEILLGLATSKKDIKDVIKGITRAMFTIVGLIIFLLILTLLSASNLVLKPLYHLVEAAQKIEGGQFGTQISIETDTEIGLLTESFNKMSRRVAEARMALESKIKELEFTNTELQTTQAQLVQSAKMVSLGQLVAGVAHELNNPIGFIYSNMSHLRDYSNRLTHLVEVAEKNPSTLKAEKIKCEYDYIVDDLPRLIRSCEEGSRRVRDIVLGLRNFSRIDEAQFKEVNLESEIQNTLGLLAGEFKTRIRLHTEFKGIPKVRCYVSQINQVFMNLLTNAAQAIEGNGEVWISTASDQEFVYVTVRDSGKGIPSEIMSQIFDPFFTTKPVGQGTGLGLSISYGIIQKHQGNIEATSTLGHGTQFVVKLPIEGPTSDSTEIDA